MQKDINLTISCKITWFERSTIRRCSMDHFIKASLEFLNIFWIEGEIVVVPIESALHSTDYQFFTHCED